MPTPGTPGGYRHQRGPDLVHERVRGQSSDWATLGIPVPVS